MSLLNGSSSAEIDASIDECWEIVADFSRAPEWQQGVKEVTVVERDGEGRPLLCDAVIDAKFTTVRSRVTLSYDPPHRSVFTQVSGDPASMEGSWELAELAPDRTRATYNLAVDPGKVGLLARPLEKALRPLVVGGRPEELAREVSRRSTQRTD